MENKPEYTHTDYYTQNVVDTFEQFDREKGIPLSSEEELLFAHALANLFPGTWKFPYSNSIHEAIPYYMNSLWDARQLLKEVERLRENK